MPPCLLPCPLHQAADFPGRRSPWYAISLACDLPGSAISWGLKPEKTFHLTGCVGIFVTRTPRWRASRCTSARWRTGRSRRRCALGATLRSHWWTRSGSAAPARASGRPTLLLPTASRPTSVRLLLLLSIEILLKRVQLYASICFWALDAASAYGELAYVGALPNTITQTDPNQCLCRRLHRGGGQLPRGGHLVPSETQLARS